MERELQGREIAPNSWRMGSRRKLQPALSVKDGGWSQPAPETLDQERANVLE